MRGTFCTLPQASAVVMLLAALAMPVQAQQTWIDGNANNDWDLVTPNWNPGGTWTNLVTSDAIFGGTGETVTVTTPGVQVNDMTFNVTGYEIAGSDILTLVGTKPLITVANFGDTATISAPLAGTNGFRKLGQGTLVLSGANTFTGVLEIGNTTGAGGTWTDGGIVQLGNDNVLNPATVVRIGPTIAVNGINYNVNLDINGTHNTIESLFVASSLAFNATNNPDPDIGGLSNSGAGGSLTVNGPVIFLPRSSGGTSDTGSGKLVLGDPDAYVELFRRDRNGRVVTLEGNVDLNNSRVPYRIVRTEGEGTLESSTTSPSNLVVNAVVRDGAASAGIIKTNGGTLTLGGANEYTGGTLIAEGTISVSASGTLGANVVGNDVHVEGSTLNLASAGNLGANQKLVVNSEGHRLVVLGVGYNGLPTFTTSTRGILAINTTNYNAITDMSALGNGQWFLGAGTATSTFTAASLAPATDNVYRLGGGEFSFTGFGGPINPSVTLTVTNGVLVDDGGTQRSLLVGIDNSREGGITVNLRGDNTYTGSTTIDAGTLRLSGANGAIRNSPLITLNGINASNRTLMDHRLELDSSGALANNNNDRLGDDTTIAMHSGDFSLRGNSATATTENYGTLALQSGFVKVTIDPGTGGAATLIGDSITRDNHATVVVRGQNMGAAPAANVSNVIFETAPTLIGGALGTTSAGIIPWALVDDVMDTTGSSSDGFNTDPDPSASAFRTDLGNSFATYGDNGIRSLAANEVSGTFTAGDNIRLTSAQDPGVATLTVNSLHIDSGGSVTGASATDLTIASGGILHTSSTATTIGAAQIGSITSSTGELIVHSPNASGGSLLTIGSLIQDNAGEKVGVTVSGSNGVALTNNANAYTGVTTVYGNLSFTTIGNVGGGPTSLGNPQNAADGTIHLAGTLSMLAASQGAQSTNRDIVLWGTSRILNNSGLTLNLNGNITGVNQNLELIRTTGGGVTNVNGVINLGDGVLAVRGAVNFNSAGHDFRALIANIDTTTISIGVDHALPTDVHLELYKNVTFNLNGHDQMVASLSDHSGHQGTHGDATAASSRTITSAAAATFTVNNQFTNTWGGTISGAGLSLTKSNDGLLVLYGSNTYGGNTTVTGGTLMVNTSLANNGSDKVFIAADLDGNFANGAPTLTRATSVGNSYAGLGSSITQGLLTRADILAGDNTSGSDAYTTMQWRLGDGPGGVLVSEVLNLSDMNNDTLSTQTDVFVLRMSYDEGEIGGAFYENVAISDGRLYLAWLDDNGNWVNAVDGNFGNNATLDQQNYLGDFASFQSLYGSVLTSYVGAWGVDAVNNHVWAVLNHNSQFAVLVPEPGTAVLALAGSLLTLGRRRRPTGGR